MPTIRKAVETQEGDGVNVRRLMPIAGFRNHDPFVLWDDFSIGAGHGFPDHPHLGFEAITYLFTGSIRHEDNLGNRSTVHGGGAQRFTAGRGLVHSEMPGASGINRGIQLWINLPKRLKAIDPEYQQVDNGEFPVIDIEHGQQKILVGENSPLKLRTPVRYYDIQLNHGGRYRDALTANERGLIYIVDGSAQLAVTTLTTGQAIFLEAGESLDIHTIDGCHLMACYGQPHGEPILQYGPFVD
ncbi:MAG: pirin family protein [Gammaproteobacteria bacterium]|nr:pirin family protein [Gammaproteobacteria bacterium]